MIPITNLRRSIMKQSQHLSASFLLLRLTGERNTGLKRRETGRVCLTWPELEQVMKDLDVFLEVQSAGKLLGVDEDPVPVAGRLLSLAEQNRPETHRQVLTGHLIHLVMGRHALQVIQKLPQGRLSTNTHV